MANICIAGDSWGIGVFSGIGLNYGPTGQGIQTIFEELGHHVINISKAGGSNTLMIDRLKGQWSDTGRCLFGTETNYKIDLNYDIIDHIVFLQTDIFRERHYYGKQHLTDEHTQWKILEQSFVDSLLVYDSIDDIINDYFQKFYTELNDIGIKYDKKILVIGGWSQLHPNITNYSNLVPVIPSATKLLIPELKQDCYLSDPEWYTQLDQNTQFMLKFNLEFKNLAVVNANKLKLVYSKWNEVHPDIIGYRRIVDAILPYLAKKD
jgi:hypothetical protein